MRGNYEELHRNRKKIILRKENRREKSERGIILRTFISEEWMGNGQKNISSLCILGRKLKDDCKRIAQKRIGLTLDVELPGNWQRNAFSQKIFERDLGGDCRKLVRCFERKLQDNRREQGMEEVSINEQIQKMTKKI